MSRCAAMALVLSLGLARTWAADGGASQPAAGGGAENDARAAIAEWRLPRATDADLRDKFLVIERFARLPAADQAKDLPRFYRELAPPYMNSIIEMLLSSAPRNILDPGAGYGGSDSNAWAHQLAEAAAKMTPEQVADKLGHGRLNLAARVRAIYTLRAHQKAVETLVLEDLNSKRPAALERASMTIVSLGLRTLTPQLLVMIDRADQTSLVAAKTLLFLRDPDILQPILARVEKDPNVLALCAGLFQGPLYRKPAEPVLLNLLDSPDTELRYSAVRALYECSDSNLAGAIIRFAKDKQERFRVAAAYWASNLPADGFACVRKDLMPLLADANEEVRLQALRSFAQQKDLAAAPVILDLLQVRHDGAAGQHEVIVAQSLVALAGEQFGYDMHNWGAASPGNQRAIRKFEAWMEARSLPVPRHANSANNASSAAPATRPTDRAPTRQAADPNEVPRLIAQLSANSYKLREDAQASLVGLGLSAVAAIQEAAKDKDPERASRAGAALRRIEESSWGEPNQGLRVRLLPLRSVWKAGQAPELALEVRNGGEKAIEYSSAACLYCQIQVDGEWYAWGKDIGLAMPTGMLAPGKDYTLTIRLTDDWATPPGSALGLKGKAPKWLRLSPGRHVVRVSFTGYLSFDHREGGIPCESREVEVEREKGNAAAPDSR